MTNLENNNRLTIKRLVQLNFFNVLIFIISTIIFFYILKNNITINDNDRINIITINSLLIGFLFTGLSIIISGLEKDRIKRLNNNYYLEGFFYGIYVGVLFLCISMIISIVLFIKLILNCCILKYLELSFLISGMLYFLKSVYSLFTLTEKIRKK